MKRVTVLGGGSWGTTLALVLHDNGHEVVIWEFDPEADWRPSGATARTEVPAGRSAAAVTARSPTTCARLWRAPRPSCSPCHRTWSVPWPAKAADMIADGDARRQRRQGHRERDADAHVGGAVAGTRTVRRPRDIVARRSEPRGGGQQETPDDRRGRRPGRGDGRRHARPLHDRVSPDLHEHRPHRGRTRRLAQERDRDSGGHLRRSRIRGQHQGSAPDAGAGGDDEARRPDGREAPRRSRACPEWATSSRPASRSTAGTGYVGEAIADGRALEEILDSMVMVAEGVRTTRSVAELSEKLSVEMPIMRADEPRPLRGQAPEGGHS